MDLDQSNLLEKLLQSLNFKDPSKLKGFANGALTKLIVHTRSNRWTLYLSLASVIPYQEFLTFEKLLNSTFTFLTGVNVVIATKASKVDNSLVLDYWSWILKHCDLSATMVNQLTNYSHLKLVDDNVVLDTKSEALRDLLTNGAMVPIEDEYYQIGFPRFKIQILGGKQKLPTKVVNFPIKKTQQDITLAKRAVQALDNDSSK